MNILLFTLEYPPFQGGVASYYANIVRLWPGPGNLSILNNNQGKLLKDWLYPKWFPAVWQLFKAVRQNKIDHILVGQILPLGLVAYLLNIIKPTEYTVFIHGMDFAYALKSGRKKFITKKILKQAKNIICSNSFVWKLVSEFLGSKEKIYLVTPGIDNNQLPNTDFRLPITEKYNLSGKIVLFSIGRLVKRKGFDQVIAALSEILKIVPNLIYVIAGIGPDEEYLRQKAVAMKKNVIFLGSLEEEQKWTWLNLCDIFITVSRNINGDFEGFGIVYLEAGLAGKPVIAGDSGGVADAVIDNYTGLLVEPEKVSAIASAIIRLAQDQNLKNKLGRQGQERVLNEFGWEKRIHKIYQIISKK